MTGTLSSLSVRVMRKVNDGQFGSYGIEWEVTESLAPDANLDAETDALIAFGKVKIGAELQEFTAEQNKILEEKRKAKIESEADALYGDTLMPNPSPKAPEPEEHTFKCPMFELAKRTDGRYELKLYPDIKGTPGQWPELRYVGERDRVWAFLEPFKDDYDFSDLPKKFMCEWLVHYTLGDEFIIQSGIHKGEKSRWKNLLAIKGM